MFALLLSCASNAFLRGAVVVAGSLISCEHRSANRTGAVEGVQFALKPIFPPADYSRLGEIHLLILDPSVDGSVATIIALADFASWEQPALGLSHNGIIPFTTFPCVSGTSRNMNDATG